MIFVTSHSASDPMLSFMMPFDLMSNCTLEQPVFAPIYIQGTVQAAPDGTCLQSEVYFFFLKASRRFKIQTWLMLEFKQKKAALLLWVMLRSVFALVQLSAVPACLLVSVCRFFPQVAGKDRLLLNYPSEKEVPSNFSSWWWKLPLLVSDND